MFDAILFDLDGTLLNVNIDVFLEFYFQEMFSAAHKQGLPAERFVKKVIESTEAMINNNGSHTNEEAFMEDFHSDWEYTFESSQFFFNHFYENRFPSLKEHCRRFSLAAQIVEKAFKKGSKIAIATNAIFPLLAIAHRLNWAGVDHFHFDLITSNEIMHFCKPNPKYYEEIAELLKVNPRKCLMIGNDTGEDLIAGQAGMKTFLVEDLIIERDLGFKPDWRGSIADLDEFFNKI